MVIKKYVVSNMNEAMTKIRHELGKEAVIVSQRYIKKPGIKGFFGKKLIEVTAAIENTNTNNKNNKNNKFKNNKNNNFDGKSQDMDNSIESIKKIIESNSVSKTIGSTYKTNSINSQNTINNAHIIDSISTNQRVKEDTKLDSIELFKNSLKAQDNFKVQEVLGVKSNNEEVEKASYEKTLTRQMEEMKDLITKITIDNKNIRTKENTLKNILKESDVEEDLIEKIIDSLDDEESLEELKEKIAKMLTLNNDPISGNVVLVGPTGVGKTTTIAKLAGSLALIDKKKVGLITVDTYRIGAVEQLKTYAEIMNIPFEVVYSIKEMEETIEKMANCDVILIDTTGRSSKNSMQISELRAFLNKINLRNINLVVSSTTKNKDLKTIIDGYKILDYENVIITKLDETVSYGSILNIASIAKRPIRFLTVGQNVPDDIKSFSKEKIIDLILGESSIC